MNFLDIQLITDENIHDLVQLFINTKDKTLLPENLRIIGDWNVSNVTNMQHLFENATEFNEDISGWVTSNVTDMSYMFSGARSFNKNINISFVISFISFFYF